MQPNYSEDFTFTEGNRQYAEKDKHQLQNSNQQGKVSENMLKHVRDNCTKGDLKSCIDGIDTFCEQSWMMNLGPEKARIVEHVFKGKQLTKILEIGGYCGYSSLTFAYYAPNAKIHTVQISQEYAAIARQTQEFAGIAERCHITVGVVENRQKQIQEKGPYDVVFLDHVKQLYLSDFKKLVEYGVICKDTIVMGDNIIYPGAPDYLQNFKESSDFKSTLYHSYLEYSSTIKDALLVSTKL